MESKEKNGAPDIHLGFDVGHSSIGWAVLHHKGHKSELPDVLGCGVVTFGADDCLASKRRAYRRQRRHARSTRQRVERLEKLLIHIGALTAAQVAAKHQQAGGHGAPWWLAARILASNGDSTFLLDWPQLWDILRWYAHNRGYDGNRRWSRMDAEEELDDTEKVQTANSLMATYGKQTMAETVCAALKVDPFGKKCSSKDSYKNLNAAFPRATVEAEVRRLLVLHQRKHPGITPEFIKALMEDWQAVTVPGVSLPGRFEGGLLFGQLVPRFENRIISTCPITGEKVPTRNCREFLLFRWAMLLANIRVAGKGEKELRPLSKEERRQLNEVMLLEGYLTPGKLTSTVREITQCQRDNLQTMFLHPDSKESLLVDPVQKLVRSGNLARLFPQLPAPLQKRAQGKWRHGKTLTLAELIAGGSGLESFEKELSALLDSQNVKRTKKEGQITRETILSESHSIRRDLAKLSGRAAFFRQLMKQAYEEVLAGKHPKEEGGCLYRSEEIRLAQLQRAIDDQTNNHLVRHRLLILRRLFKDIVADANYAQGKLERIGRVTIEVNRDLRAMSGMTAKEIKQDMGIRLGDFKRVQAKLEKAFEHQKFNGRSVPITAGLIRKARIAEDQGWQCPYTGLEFEPIDLVSGRVDKDHIIPRSLRPSDSLDSLVITFSEINRMKGQRTAVQFIKEFQGQPVEGKPELSLMTLERFKKCVEALDVRKGHDDDKKRKKRRKELLLLEDYEEKEFTPRDLTVTSQLVRLGAQSLQREFIGLPAQPVITSMPGAVTGSVRKGWHLLGCLREAAPGVIDKDGQMLSKTDIRDVTHLHHALDACVLALASHIFPNNGQLWEVMMKRKPNQQEAALLRATGFYQFDAQGKPRMSELPESLLKQVSQRLAEKRVVQHIPSDMSGMRVEENTRGVVEVNDGYAKLRQRTRNTEGKLELKETVESIAKLIGLEPVVGSGKLKLQKGVRVITDNFGVAILDHASAEEDRFVIIPHHKVWPRIFTGLNGEKSLVERNHGQLPRILRNGQLIDVESGTYKGRWRIFSIKNKKAGLKVNLGTPDCLAMVFNTLDAETGRTSQRTTPGCKLDAALGTLVAGGLQILRTKLSGTSAYPTISSASSRRNAC